jgi:tetratricopeptide (TPR) repeat protein
VGVLALEAGVLHNSERTVGKTQAMPLTGILLVELLWQPAQVSHNDRNTRTLAQIGREAGAAIIAGDFGAELALYPSSLFTRVALARLGLTLGRISEALPSAIEASKMRPDFYLAHLYLGRALIRVGQLNEGCNELEIARGLSPSNSEVRYVLATTYRRLVRAEDAQRDYKEFERLKALDK